MMVTEPSGLLWPDECKKLERLPVRPFCRLHALATGDAALVSLMLGQYSDFLPVATESPARRGHTGNMCPIKACSPPSGPQPASSAGTAGLGGTVLGCRLGSGGPLAPIRTLNPLPQARRSKLQAASGQGSQNSFSLPPVLSLQAGRFSLCSLTGKAWEFIPPTPAYSLLKVPTSGRWGGERPLSLQERITGGPRCQLAFFIIQAEDSRSSEEEALCQHQLGGETSRFLGSPCSRASGTGLH